MNGRITSRKNYEQRRRALMAFLFDKACQITDEWSSKRALPEDEPRVEHRAGHVVGKLHLGYVSIMETDEQLQRLRNEPLSWGTSPARSRLMKRLGSDFVRPIDGTAARVAGGDDGQ